MLRQPLPQRPDTHTDNRPYRAPELLFGANNYDAYATDLWSLGTLFAELFTPLRLTHSYGDEEDEYYDESDENEGEGQPPSKPPFMIPRGLSPGDPDVEWTRDSLYDATRGAIGLAFSIFKVHGTPNETTWPVRTKLLSLQCVIDIHSIDRVSRSYQTHRRSRSYKSLLWTSGGCCQICHQLIRSPSTTTALTSSQSCSYILRICDCELRMHSSTLSSLADFLSYYPRTILENKSAILLLQNGTVTHSARS